MKSGKRKIGNDPIRFRLSPLQLCCRDLLDHVRFDLVAYLDVVKVDETDTALKALPDLIRIVLKAFERRDITIPGHHAVANEACFGLASYDSISDTTTGDGAEPGNFERLLHNCLA